MRRFTRRYGLVPVLVLLLGLSACSYLQPFPNTEEHIVARDETLYAIAWRYEVDFRDLADWNGIAKPYRLYPGQRLVLHPFGGGPKRRPIVQPDSEPERRQPPKKLSTVAVAGPPEQKAKAVQPSPRPKVQASEDASDSVPSTETANQPAQPSASASASPEVPAKIPAQAPDRMAKAEAPRPKTSKQSPKRPVRTRNGWAWPTAGKPADTYKDTGTGITIPGEPGQGVHAARNGKVVYAGSGLKGYGLLVIIKHSDEYLTAYGYNQRLLVAQGEEVKAGARIATMGLGPQNRSILHFELRRNGRPVDPMRVLPSPD